MTIQAAANLKASQTAGSGAERSLRQGSCAQTCAQRALTDLRPDRTAAEPPLRPGARACALPAGNAGESGLDLRGNKTKTVEGSPGDDSG